METNKNILRTAGLIVIKDNQLLLAYSKNKKAWYLPGGKIDVSETPIQSLIREIKEELNVQLKEEDLQLKYHISAQAFGEKDNLIMEQDCFLGPVLETYKASSEVGSIKYFSYLEYKAQLPIVPGVIAAFNQLMASGLIN